MVSSHNVIFHKKSILSDIASDKVEELICQKQWILCEYEPWN